MKLIDIFNGNFEKINEKTIEYKESRINRPRYKRALADKQIIKSMIQKIEAMLEMSPPTKEKEILEDNIKNYKYLLFTIDLYIVKCELFYLRK